MAISALNCKTSIFKNRTSKIFFVYQVIELIIIIVAIQFCTIYPFLASRMVGVVVHSA